jgi:uncharacterized protein (TIGR03437 family)
VVNAATFTSGIAPSGIISIFGSGLALAASRTAVDVDGAAAAVLSASPVPGQSVLPAAVTPGTHRLHLSSPFGGAQQQITVSAVAPAIFLVGDPAVGAVENQDGSLNSLSNPLPRGKVLVIYATRLGTTTPGGGYSVATVLVTAVLNGVEAPVSFAGLAPGYAGLNQINVLIPGTSVPGLGVSLTLKQGGQVSNTVSVAIQ